MTRSFTRGRQAMIPQRIGPTTGQIAGFDPGQSTLDAFILNFFSIRTEEASTWPRLFATRRSSTAFDAGIAIRAQLGKAPSSFSAPRAAEVERFAQELGLSSFELRALVSHPDDRELLAKPAKGLRHVQIPMRPRPGSGNARPGLAEVAELLPERDDAERARRASGSVRPRLMGMRSNRGAWQGPTAPRLSVPEAPLPCRARSGKAAGSDEKRQPSSRIWWLYRGSSCTPKGRRSA